MKPLHLLPLPVLSIMLMAASPIPEKPTPPKPQVVCVHGGGEQGIHGYTIANFKIDCGGWYLPEPMLDIQQGALIRGPLTIRDREGRVILEMDKTGYIGPTSEVPPDIAAVLKTEQTTKTLAPAISNPPPAPTSPAPH